MAKDFEKSTETKETTDAKGVSKRTGSRRSKPGRNGKSSSYRNTGTSTNAVGAQINNIGDLNFLIPVYDKLGPVNGSIGEPEIGGSALGDKYIPEYSIYTLEFIPTLGDTKTANVAAQKTFGEMRRKLNVPTSYEPGDLFCLIQAVQSINVTIEYCKKILRLAGTYTMLNRQYPKLALRALHQDVDEIIRKSPEYRDRLNKVIASCAYLYLPTNYQANMVRCELASKIYSDADSAKAQTIIPCPRGMWKWNLSSGTSTSPANLEWIDLIEHDQEYRTFDSILTELEDCVYDLMGDSDAQRIFGDILKVWETNAWVIPQEPITADETQEITFDPVFLYMLHNATVLTFSEQNTVPSINWVIPTGGSNPELTQAYHVQGAKYFNAAELIDLPEGLNPTANDILNMCRWKYYTEGVKQESEQSVDVLGANALVPMEILVNFEAWNFKDNPLGIATSIDTSYFEREPDMAVIQCLSPLSVYPLIYVTKQGTDGNWPYPDYILGDRNNYALITSHYMRRVQSVLTQINYVI
jgi:hypothetical protein